MSTYVKIMTSSLLQNSISIIEIEIEIFYCPSSSLKKFTFHLIPPLHFLFGTLLKKSKLGQATPLQSIA